MHGISDKYKVQEKKNEGRELEKGGFPGHL